MSDKLESDERGGAQGVPIDKKLEPGGIFEVFVTVATFPGRSIWRRLAVRATSAYRHRSLVREKVIPL